MCSGRGQYHMFGGTALWLSGIFDGIQVIAIISQQRGVRSLPAAGCVNDHDRPPRCVMDSQIVCDCSIL